MCTETVNVDVVVVFTRGRLSLETCQCDVVKIVIRCRKRFLVNLDDPRIQSQEESQILEFEYDLVTFLFEVGLSCNHLRFDIL